MTSNTVLGDLIGRHLLWSIEGNGCYNSYGVIENLGATHFLVRIAPGQLRMISFDEHHVVIEHEPFERESGADYPFYYVVDPDAELETHDDADDEDEDDESTKGDPLAGLMLLAFLKAMGPVRGKLLINLMDDVDEALDWIREECPEVFHSDEGDWEYIGDKCDFKNIVTKVKRQTVDARKPV